MRLVLIFTGAGTQPKQFSEAQAAQLTVGQSTYSTCNLMKSGNEIGPQFHYCRNAAKQDSEAQAAQLTDTQGKQSTAKTTP